MNAIRCLAELVRRGIEVWPEGQTLRYRAPEGALTPDLRDLIVTHKAEILDAFDRGLIVRCLVCGGLAVAKPDERRGDPEYNDLWQGACECGSVFSTANLTGILVSQMLN